jgi:hypothetical protein
MKKIIILAIIFLVFTFGVLFGKSWAQNSWITAAVNKAITESGQTENAAVLSGLNNCKLIDGISSNEAGKEAHLKCTNAQDQIIKLKATAVKDGKILIFNKYKFEGVAVESVQ